MNIKYDANLGESKMTEILTPTSDKIYYRTLNFQCKDLGSESIDQLTQFLDEKIELAKVVVSSEAIVLVSHNAHAEPNRQVIDHVMTLFGARILTCDSLRWGFVPHEDCDGYLLTIYLPTTVQAVTPAVMFDALKQNGKPAFDRIEIKPPHIWGKLLVWVGARKRKYRVTINGAQYEM